MDPTRFDPDKLGERSRLAYDALYGDRAGDGDLPDGGDIWDGQWHPWPAVVEKMLTASDLTPKSCSDIIRGLEHTGHVLRRGAFRPGKDERQLRFIDTCELGDRSWYTDDEWAEEQKRYANMLRLVERAKQEARQRSGR